MAASLLGRSKSAPKEGATVPMDGTDCRVKLIQCEKVRNEKNEMIEEHHHVLLDDLP
jgi:hypothetical protein